MTDDRTAAEGDAAFDSLLKRVSESMRLTKLTNRELVFEISHSEAADNPAVEEMMYRLSPDWDQVECPPDCPACKREAMSNG